MNPIEPNEAVDLNQPLVTPAMKAQLEAELKRLDKLETLLPKVKAAGIESDLSQESINELRNRIRKLISNLS